MEEQSIEALFEQFRSRGDAAALGSVFDATAGDLLSIARHLTRDRASAEDLVQATFLAAIENAARFDATRPLKPWLVGILVRQAGLARRKRSATTTLDSLEHASKDDPLAEISARELSDALTRAFEQLSPSDREVLVPLLVDGKRAVEIARELARRPDTVHMRIHRGLARLRRLLPAGLSLGAVIAFTSRRGLAATRRVVMNAAQRAAGMNPHVAPNVATATAIGGVLVSQKLAVAAAVILAALGLGWLAWHPTPLSAPVVSSSATQASAAVSTNGTRSAGEMTNDATAATSGSSRSSIAVDSAATARFTIVESDGTPASGVIVALVGAHETVQSLTTDNDGSIALGASGERIEAYIARARALPFHAVLALVPGPQRIDLPAGKEVSGHLRVNGATPDRAVDLVLRNDRSPLEDARARADVAKALGFDNYRWFVVRQKTGTDGQFRWQGLPDDWSGSIFVSHFYKVPGPSLNDWGEDTVRLDAPTSSVVIDLERRPCLKGRVIDAGDRKPVAGARIAWSVAWSDGLNASQMGARADDLGRFEIPLKESGFLTAELGKLTDADGRGVGRAKFERSDLGPDLDVGDVLLERPPTRDIQFSVRDAAGRPIAGALAKVGQMLSQRTDAKGRGVLAAVPLDAERLNVYALGFHSAQLELGATKPSTLDVVLEPTNELFVQVVGIPDESRDEFSLQLASAEPLFDSETPWLPSWFSVSAGSCTSSVTPNGRDRPGYVRCSLDESGRFVVHDLRPRVAATLRVVGPLDVVLREEALAPIGPTEQRRIVAQLDAAGFALEGRVSSEDGKPLSNAQVSLRRRHEASTSTATDGSGRFRIKLARAESLQLTASHPGWVTCDLADVSPSAVPIPLDIRLEHGHDVAIELVDARGHVVQDAHVRARTESRPTWWGGIADGRDHFVLRDLPALPCTIIVEVGGKSFERLHDARVPSLRFELPAFGRVEFTWKHGVETEPDREVEVRLRSVGGESEPLEWMTGSVAEGTHTFTAVLPGEYTISLERWSRESADAPVIWTPIMPLQHVAVVADETVRVDLRP